MNPDKEVYGCKNWCDTIVCEDSFVDVIDKMCCDGECSWIQFL
jgi:hypothetical protein